MSDHACSAGSSARSGRAYSGEPGVERAAMHRDKIVVVRLYRLTL
jgi:hypothetical protein